MKLGFTLIGQQLDLLGVPLDEDAEERAPSTLLVTTAWISRCLRPIFDSTFC